MKNFKDSGGKIYTHNLYKYVICVFYRAKYQMDFGYYLTIGNRKDKAFRDTNGKKIYMNKHKLKTRKYLRWEILGKIADVHLKEYKYKCEANDPSFQKWLKRTQSNFAEYREVVFGKDQGKKN